MAGTDRQARGSEARQVNRETQRVRTAQEETRAARRPGASTPLRLGRVGNYAPCIVYFHRHKSKYLEGVISFNVACRLTRHTPCRLPAGATVLVRSKTAFSRTAQTYARAFIAIPIVPPERREGIETQSAPQDIDYLE